MSAFILGRKALSHREYLPLFGTRTPPNLTVSRSKPEELKMRRKTPLEELEERAFEYAKLAGVKGFKNGKEVIAALERYGAEKSLSNRKVKT